MPNVWIKTIFGSAEKIFGSAEKPPFVKGVSIVSETDVSSLEVGTR